MASPVGENLRVVVPGETGLWAAGAEEWERALERLLASTSERRRMGAAGRESLRGRYDLPSTAGRAAALLDELVVDRSR